jgi:hypothetical protein
LAPPSALSPGLGGQAAARNALRHQRGAALLRLIVRGVVDIIGGWPGASRCACRSWVSSRSRCSRHRTRATARRRSDTPSWRLPPFAPPHTRRAERSCASPAATAPFLGGHERAVEAQLAFLRRHLLA